MDTSNPFVYYLYSSHFKQSVHLLDSLSTIASPIAYHPYVNDTNLIIIDQINSLQLVAQLLDTSIIYVESRTKKAVTEIPIHRFIPKDYGFNHIQRYYPEATGSLISTLIKEHRFDTADMDLQGRSTLLATASLEKDLHATTMATLLGGAGITDYWSKGLAPNVKLYSTGFSSLIPEDNASILDHQISVTNHSYGTDIENNYNIEAMLYDKQSVDIPNLLHVFSAGNLGQEITTNGTYSGLRTANISGAFKQSKNSICIGALDMTNGVYDFSSNGPAFDGRIKPELVSYGEDGTSGSAATASGIAAICQDYFYKKNHFIPPSYLIKSILINSAIDILHPGPDYQSGFGKINPMDALTCIKNEYFILDTLSALEEKLYHISMMENTYHMDCTLAWLDPPARIGSKKALINDLDLSINSSSHTLPYLPWILNTDANVDSLNADAKRGIDSLNPVEKISLDIKSKDSFWIHVKNKSNQRQAFAMAYQFLKEQQFLFTYPIQTDFLWPDSIQSIHWNWTSSVLNPMNKIDYKYLDDSTWNNIGFNISLAEEKFNFKTEHKIGLIQFRIILPDTTYYSDTIRICYPLKVKIPLLCKDSFLLEVEPIDGVNYYDVNQLNFNQAVSIAQSRSPSIPLSTALNSTYIRVTPVFNSFTGIPGTYFQPKQIAANCYIQLFDAIYAANNEAELILHLNQISKIQQINIYRRILNQKKELIFTIEKPNITSILNFKNQISATGLYQYEVEVLDEQDILDQAIDAIYLSSSLNSYNINSNLINQQHTIQLFSPHPSNKEFILYDQMGRFLFSIPIYETLEWIEIPNLPLGIYLITIKENNRFVYHTKIAAVN